VVVAAVLLIVLLVAVVQAVDQVCQIVTELLQAVVGQPIKVLILVLLSEAVVVQTYSLEQVVVALALLEHQTAEELAVMVEQVLLHP
jgi:hypothetical protein